MEYFILINLHLSHALFYISARFVINITENNKYKVRDFVRAAGES